MKSIITSGVLLVLLGLPLFSAQAATEQLVDASLDLGVGYRVDQLDWNIAGDAAGSNPNVLSELIWDDLNVVQFQAEGRIEFAGSRFSNFTTVFKGLLAYGQIYSGDNQDSDFGGDNRTLEWSRSNNAADDGRTFDLSAGVGLKFRLPKPELALTSFVGYSSHHQDLQISDGRQTLSDDATYDAIYGAGPDGPAPLGPITGLDSSYDARWRGPWVGIEADFSPTAPWQLTAGVEYHWADYVGKADWNLRSDFAHPLSFKHDSGATGLVLNLASTYQINDSWAFLIKGNYQDWQTESGTDQTYLAAGGSVVQQLNEVNWQSYAVLVGLSYRF